MKSKHVVRGLLPRAPLATAVALALLAAPAAQAFDFENGELTGSLDTTISYGISVRTEDQDPDLIGKAQFNPLLCAQNSIGTVIPPNPLLPAPPVGPNPLLSNPLYACSKGFPGSAAQVAAPGRFSVNRDDGNLKYDEGDAFSNAFKITSELSLKYRSWGAFARATYFYDFENEGRDDLTEAAKEKVGADFRLLDAFIFKDFELGGHKGTWRLGRQAVSWGESTFIQNGINVINPIDVSKLRVAGAELKEAFMPIDMAWVSFQFTDNLSMEALYMFEFEEVEIDPSGTYFSSNDFASPGGTYVMLGFGTAPQPVANPELYAATCQTGPTGVLNSDLLDDYTAAAGGNATLGAAAVTIGCANAVQRLPNRNAKDSGQWGIALRWYAEALGQTDFAFYFLNYHSRLPLLSGLATNITPTQLAAGLSPGAFAGYFVEYPEDIQLFGMSWNTTLPGGIAWQGEISHRPNMPLQVDDVELLFAAFTPINPVLAVAGMPPAGRFYSQLGSYCQAQAFTGTCSLEDRYIRGWRRHEVSQLQMTFTKAFAEVLGADQLALVGELGATEVWDLPAQSELRYEGEGTDTGGGPDVNQAGVITFWSCTNPSIPSTCAWTTVPNSTVGGAARNPQTLTGGFPTQFSWGYRLAARADYNGVFGSSINLSPRIAFNHDVNGITPGPGGNFLEGRKSGTIGVEANYQNKLAFDLSYTRFWGGEPFNQIADRDFASFTVKYSF
jgi:hypothetical protein